MPVLLYRAAIQYMVYNGPWITALIRAERPYKRLVRMPWLSVQVNLCWVHVLRVYQKYCY